MYDDYWSIWGNPSKRDPNLNNLDEWEIKKMIIRGEAEIEDVGNAHGILRLRDGRWTMLTGGWKISKWPTREEAFAQNTRRPSRGGRDGYIEMLYDTLQIFHDGFYEKDGKKIDLKLSKPEQELAYVYLPDELEEIFNKTDFNPIFSEEGCRYSCENIDSFALARKRYKDFDIASNEKNRKEILVLNLANPVHPGGGVRRGARAQEEDLCRKSSLLISLEGEKARRYYDYNKSLHTYMGSDALIFSPKVEIIKDEKGQLLDETVIVAVLTCAAPMLRNGMEGMSQEEYQAMVYKRITGMLKSAAYFGYSNLILGAWGCGAFGNDANIMSDLFYKALKELEFNGRKERDLFQTIDFAVLDFTYKKYNFQQFYRNFSSN